MNGSRRISMGVLAGAIAAAVIGFGGGVGFADEGTTPAPTPSYSCTENPYGHDEDGNPCKPCKTNPEGLNREGNPCPTQTTEAPETPWPHETETRSWPHETPESTWPHEPQWPVHRDPGSRHPLRSIPSGPLTLG